MRTKIKSLKYQSAEAQSFIGHEVTLKGWVRTVRNQKTFTFIEINDGSTLSNFQIIATPDIPGYANLINQLSTGVSVAIKGTVVESPGKEQSLEMHATEVTIIGKCDPEVYPLQKKRHTFEFLRTIAHLRPRTNTIGAVTRVRNALAFATHQFFQSKGFLYIHTPVITGSDCEGAGKMFQVTTLDPANPPKTPQGKVDYTQDFFGKPAYLTVSGQLNGEIYACALSDVYTFGPTFRAENSNTSRHLAEFWMIEPEMAFADLNDNMDCAEAYLKYVLRYVLDNCQEDMEFFNKHVSPGVIERLEHVINTPFERASYTYAVRVLEKANKSFEFPVKWGLDLQSEHERFLAEEFFAKPVILTDYPKQIKAFYMRTNEDNKTVAAMDVLVPKVGEIIGGSQREERLSHLEAKLREFNLPAEEYWWYLELRKYGSVPHAGFGAGFERLVQFATGMENIRDVIPFPRYPGKADF
ncbi:Asparagine--tRNA ligase [Candidatus Protochlamydia naegleriophila]|uniref:Asparagine--tRNA ligase n=1 Tax=Candidatus Protochlamydia naegleriophila TaxID=389348 RepID=A0A0U5JB34_9BACT|nr:asparagine--tRNA ligase [Candidatus Protochlamydia naegleriophila]CUI16026.1 Asparagine--tRNA ligase [Candidatus Protochlamydia naegleriophila]